MARTGYGSTKRLKQQKYRLSGVGGRHISARGIRMTDTAIIAIERMTKVFYTDEIETHALSGIHLEINRGEYVAMSGPSGCGKSTLLSIIGFLGTPPQGEITPHGKQGAI